MANGICRSSLATAWFVRASSVVVVVFWVLGIINHGWSNDLCSFRSLTGIIGAAMLCLLSFIPVTSGKAKKIFAIGTIILAMGVIALSVAGLLLPRP